MSPSSPQSSQTARQPPALNIRSDQQATLPQAVRISSSSSSGLIATTFTQNEIIRTISTEQMKEDVSLYPDLPFVPVQRKSSVMPQPLSQSADCTTSMALLENFMEPSSVKSRYSYHYEAKCASLALHFGPLFVKRLSKQQEETYEVSSNGYWGFNVAVRLPLNFMSRIVFTLYAMKHPQQCLSFSLRWNVSFPRIVPNSAPIWRLTRNGDITTMEDLFKTGKASLHDMYSDGTNLLHVSFSVLDISGILILIRLLLGRTTTRSLSIS